MFSGKTQCLPILYWPCKIYITDTNIKSNKKHVFLMYLIFKRDNSTLNNVNLITIIH